MENKKNIKPTFESCLDLIEELLEKRKYKWQIKAIAWIDFDDVKQIIKLHLFKKWEKYQPDKPLEPWINAIINHQMINIGRNIYTIHARPCLKCPSNEGNDLCGVTPSGKQCEECPVYKKWAKTKKSAFDIQLALPIVNHEQEVHDIAYDDLDINTATEIIHKEMKKILKPHEWRVYECLYIFNLSEHETAKRCGFKSSEGRSPGYARIKQIQKVIINQVKKLKNKIDFF